MENNFKIFPSNNQSYEILTDLFNNTYLFFNHIFIKNLANHFNCNNYKTNKFASIIIINGTSVNYIKQILSKYYTNIRQLYLIESSSKLELIKLIKKSKLIITDSDFVMQLSAIYFTTCILLNNKTKISNEKKIIQNLNYIKFIFNIEQLETIIITFPTICKKQNYYDFFDKIKNKFQ